MKIFTKKLKFCKKNLEFLELKSKIIKIKTSVGIFIYLMSRQYLERSAEEGVEFNYAFNFKPFIVRFFSLHEPVLLQ